MTTSAVLESRGDVIRRYVDAYRKAVDWMYASDDALKMYAEFAQISPELARRVRDDFFPKALLWPDRISGLDTLQADGVTFKFLREPLTAQQLEQVIQIPQPAK